MQEAEAQVVAETRRLVEGAQWRDACPTEACLRDALAAIKPSLRFARVRADISPEIVPPGARRGFWHVVDYDAKPLPNFIPIAGEAGGYRSPDSGVLRELRAMDMRNADVARRTFDRGRIRQSHQQKARALRKEQERDVLKEDLKAGWRVAGRIYDNDGKLRKRKLPSPQKNS